MIDRRLWNVIEQTERQKGFTEDDIVLLSKDAASAVDQLRIVFDSLLALGMRLSIDKCSTFEYRPSGKTWYVTDPKLEVGAARVPYVEPDEAFRYLGVRMTPWKGLLRGFELSTFREIIQRAKALPLKPMQKIDLLTRYLFPRFTYGLVASSPSRSTLARINLVVRTEVKRILRLSPSTSSEFLYSPRRVGGLGLLKLEVMVPIAILRNGIKALESDDPLVPATFKRFRTARFVEYAKFLGVPWPLTLFELDQFKVKSRHAYKQRWAEQVWRSQGAHNFAEHPISNLT